MKRFVLYNYPYKSPSLFFNNVTGKSRNISVYKTVECSYNGLKPVKKKIKYEVPKSIKLRDVVNLHNHTGMRDVDQIQSMVKFIKSGCHVVSYLNYPNIKLVKTIDQKWVLFDGHHSMIAYMASGKEFLGEVPFIAVYNMGKEYAEPQEISAFFGAHAKKVMKKEWTELVINWQAPENEQLCPRIQNNMGELYDALKTKWNY
jgi:hypothetical protein